MMGSSMERIPCSPSSHNLVDLMGLRGIFYYNHNKEPPK